MAGRIDGKWAGFHKNCVSVIQEIITGPAHVSGGLGALRRCREYRALFFPELSAWALYCRADFRVDVLGSEAFSQKHVLENHGRSRRYSPPLDFYKQVMSQRSDTQKPRSGCNSLRHELGSGHNRFTFINLDPVTAASRELGSGHNSFTHRNLDLVMAASHKLWSGHTSFTHRNLGPA